MAERMAETKYTEQRQLSENQAEMLKIQQEIANSKARADVYGNLYVKSIDSVQHRQHTHLYTNTEVMHCKKTMIPYMTMIMIEIP